MRAMVWLWVVGCGGAAVDSGDGSPVLPDVPVDPGVEDPGAEDPGNGDPEPEEPGDPVVTDACLEDPSELWCGVAETGDPVRLLQDGDEVIVEGGQQGTGHIWSGLIVRNVPQLVRVRYKVQEVETGVIRSEATVNKALAPLNGGAWACEGTLSGEQIMFDPSWSTGVVEHQRSICGLEVDLTMEIEAPTAPDEPRVVYSSGTVRVTLQPDPDLGLHIGRPEVEPVPPCR
jgi:hypothetical protein